MNYQYEISIEFNYCPLEKLIFSEFEQKSMQMEIYFLIQTKYYYFNESNKFE